MVASNVTTFNMAGLATSTGTSAGTILEFDSDGNVLPTAGTFKTVASIDTAINEQGGARRGRKVIGRNSINLIVRWCGLFLFFVVPCQFSQVFSEWPENQVLIPDWTYFHCPGTTLINAPYAMSWAANGQYTYDSSSSVQALAIWDTLSFGNSANMATKTTWTYPATGLAHCC